MAFTMRGFFASFTAFVGRRDNPHQVTAAQVNTYTREETSAIFSTKIPNGVLPIFAYGTADETPIQYTVSGWTFTITAQQPVLIYGTPMSIDGATLDANRYVNTTGYLYVELQGGAPVYTMHDVILPDTNVRIRIGSVTCDATSIEDVDIVKARGVIASTVSGGGNV